MPTAGKRERRQMKDREMSRSLKYGPPSQTERSEAQSAISGAGWRDRKEQGQAGLAGAGRGGRHRSPLDYQRTPKHRDQAEERMAEAEFGSQPLQTRPDYGSKTARAPKSVEDLSLHLRGVLDTIKDVQRASIRLQAPLHEMSKSEDFLPPMLGKPQSGAYMSRDMFGREIETISRSVEEIETYLDTARQSASLLERVLLADNNPRTALLDKGAAKLGYSEKNPMLTTADFEAALKTASGDSKESKFEEGVSADPTKNMSKEDAAEWKKQTEEHKDEFKTAHLASLQDYAAELKDAKFEKDKSMTPEAVSKVVGPEFAENAKNPPPEVKKLREEMESKAAALRLTPKDKKVIQAFLDHKEEKGTNLSTDGKKLDGLWMGGNGIAVWEGDTFDLRDVGSKTSQIVQNAIRKEAPANWVKKASALAGSLSIVDYVNGLREAKFPKDKSMTVDEVAKVVGPEFKENVENPPESVKKVREEMQGKTANLDKTAGYTHYWKAAPGQTGVVIPSAQWSKLLSVTSKILDVAATKGISVRDGVGEGEPLLNNKYISLNGDAALGESYETFYFTRTLEEFSFCKTNRKPYDAVVVSILAQAKKILADLIVVHSDGGDGAIRKVLADQGSDKTAATLRDTYNLITADVKKVLELNLAKLGWSLVATNLYVDTDHAMVRVSIKGPIVRDERDTETARKVLQKSLDHVMKSNTGVSLGYEGRSYSVYLSFDFAIVLNQDSPLRLAAAGLYGFTKEAEKVCGSATSKLAKFTSKLAKEIYSKDAETPSFLEEHNKRTASKAAKMLRASMADIGPGKPAKTAAKSGKGRYGFSEKTAKLALEACNAVEHQAGLIASDTHGRMGAKHATITGFLNKHAKRAKCGWSDLILEAYPTADEAPAEVVLASKKASALDGYTIHPSVDEILSWDNKGEQRLATSFLASDESEDEGETAGCGCGGS